MMLRQIIAHDIAISQKLVQYGNYPVRRALAWGVARSGDGWLWWLVVAWLLWQRQAWGVRLLLALLLTAVAVAIVKAVVKRERPSQGRLSLGSDKYAFPSGHAARAGAVAVILAAVFTPFTILFVLWAAGLALARVVLARHYLTDVLIGLLLGVILAILVYSHDWPLLTEWLAQRG